MEIWTLIWLSGLLVWAGFMLGVGFSLAIELIGRL